MPCGKHHGDGATMRMGSYIGLSQAKGIHARGDTIGSGRKARIETRNALRFPHIEVVNREYGGMACEEAYVLTPVSGRTHQSMQQQQRTAIASALIVDLLAIHQHESFFDICVTRSHRRRPEYFVVGEPKACVGDPALSMLQQR